MIKNIFFNRDFFYIKKAIKTAQTIATILFKLNLWPSSASNKIIVEEEYASVRIKLDDVIKRLEILQQKLESVPIPYTKKRSNWKKE